MSVLLTNLQQLREAVMSLGTKLRNVTNTTQCEQSVLNEVAGEYVSSLSYREAKTDFYFTTFYCHQVLACPYYQTCHPDLNKNQDSIH